MKKVALFVLVALCWNATVAGRVKTIILADTRDASLYCGIKTNVSMTYSALEQAAAILDMVDEFDDPILLDGLNCTKESLQKALAGFTCSPDDAVLFFYFGHGARGSDDTSMFPQMSLHDENRRLFDDNHVPLEDVAKILQGKGARFVLVFGDCCNVLVEGLTTKKASLMVASGGNSEYDPNVRIREHLRQLLIESRGTVVTVGSEVGKPSFYKNCLDVPAHGFYTGCFWETLQNNWVEDITWEKWLNAASKATDALAQRYREEDSSNPCTQRPIYRVSMRTVETLAGQENTRWFPDTIVAPRPVQDKGEQIQPVSTGELKKKLMAISSDQNTFQYREQVAKAVLDEFFSPGARVEVVGKNGYTIVESESAAGFLERISLAQRLRNISIRMHETDSSGKIKYLLVHEVYEKKI